MKARRPPGDCGLRPLMMVSNIYPLHATNFSLLLFKFVRQGQRFEEQNSHKINAQMQDSGKYFKDFYKSYKIDGVMRKRQITGKSY